MPVSLLPGHWILSSKSQKVLKLRTSFTVSLSFTNLGSTGLVSCDFVNENSKTVDLEVSMGERIEKTLHYEIEKDTRWVPKDNSHRDNYK